MLNLITPLIETNKLYRCLAYLSCGSYIGAPGSSRPGPYRSNGPRIQEAWEPRARSRRGPRTSRTRDARRVRQETRLDAVLGHIQGRRQGGGQGPSPGASICRFMRLHVIVSQKPGGAPRMRKRKLGPGPLSSYNKYTVD